jgi:hypothetical protein
MDDPFELPVEYKGEIMHFPAQFLQIGYLHRFLIEVDGKIIVFEPDEERNYRALVDAEQVCNFPQKHIELLQAIAASLEGIAKYKIE